MSQELLGEKEQKLLVFLDLAKSVDGKTKLQKLFFLGETEKDLQSGFNFTKYNYGPYSFELSNSLHVLQTLGLVQVSVSYFATDGPFDGKKITYLLTDKGKSVAESLKTNHARFIQVSKTILAEWGNKSLTEIIKYVYGKYM